MFQDPEYDKYDFESEVKIDCDNRVHLCQATCCRLPFALSKQDIREGIVHWDLGQPYLIEHGADGYCSHLDRESAGLHHLADRPVPCRGFDCSNDKRIWLDFEKRIVNSDIERRRLARVPGASARARGRAMIRDLDKTLEELLEKSCRSLDGLTPRAGGDQLCATRRRFLQSVSRPAIDLFLYDVRENRELRNNEWRVDRNAPARYQKARTDARGLLLSDHGLGQREHLEPLPGEHRMLGEVMRVLLRHAILPAGIPGDLRGQEPPCPPAPCSPVACRAWASSGRPWGASRRRL